MVGDRFLPLSMKVQVICGSVASNVLQGTNSDANGILHSSPIYFQKVVVLINLKTSITINEGVSKSEN